MKLGDPVVTRWASRDALADPGRIESFAVLEERECAVLRWPDGTSVTHPVVDLLLCPTDEQQ